MKKKINIDLATRITLSLFSLFVAILIRLSLSLVAIEITMEDQILIIKIVFGIFGGLSGIFELLSIGFYIVQKINAHEMLRESQKIINNPENTKND